MSSGGVNTDPDVLVKSPEEIIIKHYDFSGPDLAAGVTLASVSNVQKLETVDDALQVQSNGVAPDNINAQVQISGGTAGKAIKVKVHGVMSDGQARTVAGVIQVGSP